MYVYKELRDGAYAETPREIDKTIVVKNNFNLSTVNFSGCDKISLGILEIHTESMNSMIFHGFY